MRPRNLNLVGFGLRSHRTWVYVTVRRWFRYWQHGRLLFPIGGSGAHAQAPFGAPSDTAGSNPHDAAEDEMRRDQRGAMPQKLRREVEYKRNTWIGNAIWLSRVGHMSLMFLSLLIHIKPFNNNKIQKDDLMLFKAQYLHFCFGSKGEIAFLS